MQKAYQEFIDFFQDQEGWNKDEVLAEYLAEVLKEQGCIMHGHTLHADEIGLNWDNNELPVVLSDFANALFDKIIDGVCNVIKTP